MNITERLQKFSPGQRDLLAKQLRGSATAAPAQKRLVAYVVPTPGQKADTAELREFLASKLPDYMVPSAVVFLDALPQTPNGKVDRKALPAPESVRSTATRDFVAPRTPVEEQLATIWGEVLRTEKVGIHENFFDLGGHSLLAIQVMARVRDAFQVDLPLRSLFEALTVAQLAEMIVQAMIDHIGDEQAAELLAAES